jgi:undecaprenyl-diphosphatase
VEAFGFSYPSGHALAAAAMYVTIAILASSHLPLFRQRVVLAVLTIVVVGTVGVSRVYLAVHYASDAISGIFLGTAWACILAGIMSFLEHRTRALKN